MWDPSSLTRDGTPAVEAWSLNYWTAREVRSVTMLEDIPSNPQTMI